MKRKIFILLTMLFSASFAFAQYTNTPNIGLKVPLRGSNNWDIPLYYDWTMIDNMLGGQTPLPNGLQVIGPVSMPGFTFTSSQIVAGLGYQPLNPANNLSDINNAATALANLGGIGSNSYQGTWSSSTSYSAAALVNYNGVAYISLQTGNVNNEPDSSPTYWGPFGGSPPMGSSTVFGILKCGSGTTCASGVISASGGASPGGTAGAMQYYLTSSTLGGLNGTGFAYLNGSSAPTIATSSQLASAITSQVENIFTGPGTINFTHNLNDEYPLYSCFSLSGAQAISVTPVDVNNMAVTTAGAATILCSFTKTAALTPNFSINISPTSLNYVPSLAGTQNPTFSITQAIIAGYSGTVTYSTTGLASGMSSSYSPATITGSGSNTLTLSFPNTQASGATTFNVSGTDGSITHTGPATITISDINQNLLDGWDMREGSGTTFNDATTNANNMTFAAGIGTWGTVSGFPGTSFTFNGTGHATGSNDTLTNFDCSSSFTVTFWAKITSAAAYNRVIGDLATYGWLIQQNTSGGISFYLSWNDSITDAMDWTSINIVNSLHYFAYVYSGSGAASTSTMYIDGVAQTVHTNNTHAAGKTCAAGNPMFIGGNASPISGTIADVAIYSGAKTSTQIAAYYAAGIK